MNKSNNFRNILRTLGIVLGLPLLVFGGLLSLLLGQIVAVGVADRFGISPLVGFNILNILLIGLFAGFLFFVKRRSESPHFVRRLRQSLQRFSLPKLNLSSWRSPSFAETPAETKTASTSVLIKEPICKILVIHYQPAASDCVADNSNLDSQNGEKAYAKTNNF